MDANTNLPRRDFSTLPWHIQGKYLDSASDLKSKHREQFYEITVYELARKLYNVSYDKTRTDSRTRS